MKRKVSLILAILMVMALLAACGGDSSSTGGAAASQSTGGDEGGEPAAADPVEVTLWHFPVTEDAEDVFGNQLAAAVKEQYPHITLKTEMLPWDAGPERITVAMATGSMPDLLFDGQSRQNPGIFAGLTADITDVREEIAGDLLAGYENHGLMDGKYYFMPTHNGNGYNLMVNMAILKELGIEDMLPDDMVHWSYDEFLDLCRAVREKGADQSYYPIQLFAGSRSSDAAMYSFFMSAGASIMNDDLTAMAVDSPESLACLGMLKTLIDEGLVPDGAATTKDENVGAMFQSGKTVFQIGSAGAQQPILIRSKVENGEIEAMDLDIVCLPTPDGQMDPMVANWGAGGLSCYSTDADKIEASKNVMRVLWNDTELLTHLNLLMGQSPVNKNVVLDYGDDHINEMVVRATEWNGLYSDSSIGIMEPWWTDWREIFYVELQEFYVGNQTAEQMLANWTTKGDAVISDYFANAG